MWPAGSWIKVYSSFSMRMKIVYGLNVVVLLVMIQMVNSDDLCFLPLKVGFCRAEIPRWYYNSLKNSCDKFYFGGCYGNENNFHTKKDCIAKCQGFSCKVHYQAIGCYQHYRSPQMGYVLSNDRDVNSDVFSGVLIDWLRWNQYVPDMLCRCATKAAKNGFNKFAILNLGECLGTNDFKPEHFNASAVCLDRFYGQQCATSTDMCVGGPQAHYFYSIANK